MQIVSLNAWGGALHEALLAYLAQTRPDVLCLQEVVHTPASENGWLTYRDGDHVLPQRANLLREVCAVLPDHVATFCPAAQGVLSDGDTAFPSQWGLATFVHQKFPVVGQAQGFVHKDYSPDGYGDHPRSRSAHGVRLYDEAQQRFISVTHMHGLRDPRGKIDTAERAAQAGRLIALSDHLSRPHDLRVICGDFNVDPGSKTLALLAERGFVELVTSRGIPGTRTSRYAKPGRFADYMLVDDETAVAAFSVVTWPEVSDHCPLDLTLGPPLKTGSASPP